MDIFIINSSISDKIDKSLLYSFQKKSISSENYKNNHCLSYLITDKILKEVYNIENREIFFDSGKPFIKDNTKFLSISHSCEYIALAFSDYPCGIDIEKIRPRDYKKIAKRMKFSVCDIGDFYACWTKYEAEYKLNNKPESLYQFILEDYYVTAVSMSHQENFEIYIQNRTSFSK